MEKIKITKAIKLNNYGKKVYEPGTVLEVTDQEADILIRKEFAVKAGAKDKVSEDVVNPSKE